MKFLLVLLIVSLLSLSTTVTAEMMQKSPLMGGYSEIADLAAEERLTDVKQYIWTQLSSSPYTFAKQVSSTRSSSSSNLQIVQAWRQIVAGQNFKCLMLVLKDKHEPLGAFEVTVYDQFGNLADITWGKQYSLEKATEIWKQLQGESS